MKKYLTMVLAIAISGVFVGCHEDELSGSLIEQKKIAFEDAFIQAFGQPDPNHNWGFRMPDEKSLTRSENANANEWADPDKAYGGLLVPPPLTDAQIAVVKKYFQTVQNPTYEDPHWTNYFMQQVYKGYTDPMTGTDPKTGKPYSPEWYKAADGNTKIYASNNMDHLAAIDESKNFVDHINNFNHGDCSVNNNVLDNGYHTNDNKFHSDKIMYMKESTTKSFGYYNSNGSVRRTEYTGLVGFQTIINELGAEANCLNDGWNRSFMGFDFEQMVGPEIISQEKYSYKGKEYPVLVANQNMYCGIFYKKADGSDLNDTDLQQEGFIDNLLAEGYLPVSGGAGKKWVKVGGCADGYYSDWIVCLTEAKTSQTPPPSDPNIVCRIIVEDLTVGESSDFDFNDVVFDVCKDGTLIIRAIGGELPIYIGAEGANEVHAVCSVTLGDTNKGANSHTMMRNTGWSSSGSKTNVGIDYDAVLGKISLGRTFSSKEEAKEIEIWVHKNGTNIRLQAPVGKVASMICVGQDYKWCAERQDIDDKYHKDGVKLFHQYVIGDPNYGDDWEHKNAWYQKLDQ